MKNEFQKETTILKKFTSWISINMWHKLRSLKLYNILLGTDSIFVTDMFDGKYCKYMKKKIQKYSRRNVFYWKSIQNNSNNKISAEKKIQYWAMLEWICFNINFHSKLPKIHNLISDLLTIISHHISFHNSNP